jgi:hypothetical protein
MIQPATLIEQQAAGEQKISTYFGCEISKIPLVLLML